MGRWGVLAGCLLWCAVALSAPVAAQSTPVPWLSVDPAGGIPGVKVAVRGGNFNAPGDTDGSTSHGPVVVRFGGLAGPVVWSGPPDAGGNIAFTFTVPEVPGGSRSVGATQVNDVGALTPESSASALFAVDAPPAPATDSQAASPATAPATTAFTAPPASSAGGLADEVIDASALVPADGGGGTGPWPTATLVTVLAVAAGGFVAWVVRRRASGPHGG